MKYLITIIITAISISAKAQSDDTLFMSKLSNSEWTQDFSNQTQFKYVKFEDGSILGIGDKMKYGNPSGTNQSNTTSSGIFGGAGNTTRVNNFSYIMLGRMASALLAGIVYVPETWKGREAEIENIKLYKSKKESKPSVASIIFKNPGMDVTVLDLSFALQYGELINLKASMTSDQALSELKKAKDKLDLGLITQKDFDSLKNILAPIIK